MTRTKPDPISLADVTIQADAERQAKIVHELKRLDRMRRDLKVSRQMAVWIAKYAQDLVDELPGSVRVKSTRWTELSNLRHWHIVPVTHTQEPNRC